METFIEKTYQCTVSVAEPDDFYADLVEYFDADAAPAPTLLYSKPIFLKIDICIFAIFNTGRQIFANVNRVK
jgi:hypothetical protein